ncbi:MAG: hypothetical protein ACP5QO_08285 [Clostridia bacterium]
MTPHEERPALTRLRLEAALALAPAVWLIPAALVVLGFMHTGIGGGAGVWRANFPENTEALLPVAFGLASAHLLLVEHDDGQIEITGAYPMAAVARTRLLALIGGGWLLVLVGLLALRVLFGPVPFWSGVLTGIGPGLFLGGIACWAAASTGRVTMGYLLAVGIPVMDLVLRLLGGFHVLWPLQFLNVFAWRWPLVTPPWWLVKVLMGAVGLFCYARAAGSWRTYSVRHL